MQPALKQLAKLHLTPAVFTLFALIGAVWSATGDSANAAPEQRLQKRWLFVWRNMDDPKEVERVIARFPQAKAGGYNGVAFSWNVAPGKAAEFKQAAKENGLDLVAIVMGGAHDHNYVEGVPVKDAVFVAHDGRAALEPDTTARVANGDFETANGNHFSGWGMQDDEGLTTFADHDVVHSGKTSLRMQDISRNRYQHCRLAQAISLQPFRQYHLSFWLKTENLSPADAEVKVLDTEASRSISFQSFHVDATQDWKHYDLVFNSLDHTNGRVYLGTWSGKSGRMWWDDLLIEEIGLVNVLRRPGCPVTVRGEDGASYEEGRDYQRIVDPQLHPWVAFHQAPLIKLTPSSRIHEGTRLRVSYYHPLIVYEDRINSCLSEPKIFADWEDEVKQADALLHPAAFLMSHDELRVMNWCAACQAKHMTPGELLAWNVHQAAGIIRKLRPDAEIWVWSDMFDPMHNAVDHYYAVNGSLAASWKGLDKDVGIVNWHGGLKGKNCRFFADLGLRQILSGYYDSDEDGSGIAQWLANTKDIPGIVGAMYTTWEDKYAAMQPWARKAWGERANLPK
ncbi:MAG TPA: carbohydrate binding domain-containing protein [Verrucomicrobiae bacterium]|nr:carbohydrate binding domain-containing protein [Verrucomicrobiae bacterium]